MTWVKKKTGKNVECLVKEGSPVGYGIVAIQKYPKIEGNPFRYSIKTSKRGSHWHHAKTKAEAEKIARTLTKQVDRKNLK